MSNKIVNWGKTYECKPSAILYPKSNEETVEIIQQANKEGRKVRVIGSGHSWTDLVPTNDILISLDAYQGIIETDHQQMTATVKAGSKLHSIFSALQHEEMALANQGDIDVQSLAGAFTSGTHGTGRDFGILATFIEEITLVKGNGELITCSETNHPELFSAARVSLGALGIITEMKIKTTKNFKLEYISKGGTLEDVMVNFDNYIQSNRNFEFYWFPFTGLVQMKLVNETDDPIRSGGFMRELNDIFVENIGYGALSELSKNWAWWTPRFSKFSADYVPKGRWVNWSHKIFATKRWVRFREMEYSIPRNHFENCMNEIVQTIHDKKFRVHMPMEVRYVKADDIMISPANGRDSVYMAVHQYIGMEYKEYFTTIEKIFLKYEGRPHFGKMNTLAYDGFKSAHPHWNQFISIRNECDPQQVMINPYLKGIFNL